MSKLAEAGVRAITVYLTGSLSQAAQAAQEAMGLERIVLNLTRQQIRMISRLGAVLTFTTGTLQWASLCVQCLSMEFVWRSRQALHRVRAAHTDGIPPAAASALDQGVAFVMFSRQGC